MKNACTLTALLLLLSVPAMAQEDSKLYFLVTGGISQPEAPAVVANNWKDGISVGGGVGYRFSPHLAAQAVVNYDRFDFDGAGLLAEFGPMPDFVDINIDGGEASVLSLSGELKASLREGLDRVSPYVTIGGGVAEVKASDIVISTSIFGLEFTETVPGASETVAMASVSAGLDIPIGRRFGTFVEGRYQSNFTDGDSTDSGSLRTGIRVNR